MTPDTLLSLKTRKHPPSLQVISYEELSGSMAGLWLIWLRVMPSRLMSWPVNITISTVSCLVTMCLRSTNLRYREQKNLFFFFFSFLRSIWWLCSLTFSRVETDRNWYVTHDGDAGLIWKWILRLSALITKSSPVFSIKTQSLSENNKMLDLASFPPGVHSTVSSNFLHSSTEKYEVENWDQLQLIAIIKSQHWEVLHNNWTSFRLKFLLVGTFFF